MSCGAEEVEEEEESVHWDVDPVVYCSCQIFGIWYRLILQEFCHLFLGLAAAVAAVSSLDCYYWYD